MSKEIKVNFTTLKPTWFNIDFLKIQDQNDLYTHSNLSPKTIHLASPEFSSSTQLFSLPDPVFCPSILPDNAQIF